MTVRWTVKAANDRGPQAESQVPSLRPLRIVEISRVLTILIFLLCLNLEKKHTKKHTKSLESK